MTIYNNGELEANVRLGEDEKYFIQKCFPGVKIRKDKIICFLEGTVPGDIEADLKEMVERLYKEFNVSLYGIIEYYGDYEGGYDVESPNVENLGKEDFDVRMASTKDLLSELKRRGIDILKTQENLLNVLQNMSYALEDSLMLYDNKVLKKR